MAAMSNSTSSIFRLHALLSGLVAQDDLDLAANAVRQSLGMAANQDVPDESLADKLVETGVMTPYQAGQFRAGKNKLNLGPYVVTDYIGQGGMGQVFKAVHKVMGRECAVKVLPLHKFS